MPKLIKKYQVGNKLANYMPETIKDVVIPGTKPPFIKPSPLVHDPKTLSFRPPQEKQKPYRDVKTVRELLGIKTNDHPIDGRRFYTPDPVYFEDNIINVPDYLLRKNVSAPANTNWPNIRTAGNVLKKKGFDNRQIAAILASIIYESLGNPTQQQIGAAKDTGVGFTQQAPNRHKKMTNTIKNWENTEDQIAYIADSIKDGEGGIDWTSGQIGSGYKSWTDAKKEFNTVYDKEDKDALHKYVRSLNAGYIRPRDLQKDVAKRLVTAQELLYVMEH